MKNCFTCSLAQEKDDKFRCGFKPTEKQLCGFPFYPVFLVKISKMQISKDKIPDRDCPTWKAKKT